MKALDKAEGCPVGESGGGDAQASRADIQQEKKYRICSGYMLREIAGEYAIIPVAAGGDSPLENTIMAPNETAVFIWKGFEQPSTVGEVAAKAAQVYDADAEVVRRAVERFVQESLAYRIMEEVDSYGNDVV